MSKRPQSGLGSVRRDFSEGATPASSQEWATTPPPPPPKRKLTGQEQRLKDIQDALAGNDVSSEKRAPSSHPMSSKPRPHMPMQSHPLVAKRPSPSNAPGDEPHAKKSRQLPAEWSEPLKPKATSSSRQPISVSSSSSTASSSKPIALSSVAVNINQSKGKVAPVFLSQEQKQILQMVQAGESVFYTGSAGTGKSVLLREIIKTMKKKYAKSIDAVAITASTGIAACNIGGVTIHSFGGIGLGIESAEELASKIRKNKKAGARWSRTKVLIIDEVSMVDGDLFDKLARIGSILRKDTKPFGGIQIVVTGDFFQLPPVTRGNVQVKFAFEAQNWGLLIKRPFNLTQVFRQKDQEFVDMLNEMRFGQLSSKSIQKFHSLRREITYNDGIGATELFPRREDVERANSTRMRNLQTEEHIYTSSDGGTITDATQREKMLSNFMAPNQLRVRLGCQVMLIKNMDDTLVNGSMGKVVRFVDPGLYGMEDGESVDNIVGSAAKKEGGGTGAGKKGKEAAPVGTGVVYPLVEFSVPNAGTRTVLVSPETWKTELPNGEIQVSRTQLPLILAWAMSIHKSQGQTLDRVKVDLGKVFEKGQAYVALSRATSMQGLQVLNFDANKVMAHPKVVAWTKTLKTVNLDD